MICRRFVVLAAMITVGAAACGGDLNVGSSSDWTIDDEGAVTDADTNSSDGNTTAPDAYPGDADTRVPDGVDSFDAETSDVDAGVDEPDAPADPCAHQDRRPPAPSTRTAINEDPSFVQVYVNNIENLKRANEQCPGDWKDLLHYMQTVRPSPDLFLVQQVSNREQLDLLIEQMNDMLPGTFAGIIAERNPDPQRSPCGAEKKLQTNAVIYRVGRFETVGQKHVWQVWAKWSGTQCKRNHQARTKTAMIKLRDKVADKLVTVASLHWATGQASGPDRACAKKNMLEAHQKVHSSGFGGDLIILGGDLNEPDRHSGGAFRSWHSVANGDRGGRLNYRDAIYHQCQSANDLQGCLDQNWTVGGSRRIDFLFAQDGQGCRAGMRRAHTIRFDEGDAADQQLTGTDSPRNYSDHRALRTEIYY